MVAAGSTALEEERDMSVLKQLGLFAAVRCCLQNSASLNHGISKVEGRGKVTPLREALLQLHAGLRPVQQLHAKAVMLSCCVGGIQSPGHLVLGQP